MLRKKVSTLLILLMAVLSAALLAGCMGSNEQAPSSTKLQSSNALAETGTIILRVNPEISIQYNKEGLVTKLEGLNDDGHAIVDDYADYIGKDARRVVQELVANINEAGYFVSAADGSTCHITIQIEPGSVLPQSDYMQALAGDVQSVVQDMSLHAKIVEIGPEDYVDDVSSASAVTAQSAGQNAAAASQPSSASSSVSASAPVKKQYIAKAKAIEIALAHAGVPKASAQFDDRELSYDDGRALYEIEFTAASVEYEYDIDAASGKILKYERNDKNLSQTAGSASAPLSPPPAAVKPQQANQPALSSTGYHAHDDDDDYDEDRSDDDDYDEDDDRDDDHDDDRDDEDDNDDRGDN